MRFQRIVATVCGWTLSILLLLTCVQAQGASEDLVSWFQSKTQALVDAVGSGDKAVWDQTLDGDCIITTEDGELVDKVKLLSELQPLPAGFTGQIKVRGLTVKELGGAAVVHYWLDEREDIFGQELRTTYVNTDVYRRVDNGWKVVAMQGTVVPRDLEAIEGDSSGWSTLVGEYRFAEKATSSYRVFLRDGVLYGGSDVKGATQLIPLAPLVFFQKGSIHLMVFVPDKSGAISEVRELHKYNEVRMKRVADLRQ